MKIYKKLAFLVFTPLLLIGVTSFIINSFNDFKTDIIVFCIVYFGIIACNYVFIYDKLSAKSSNIAKNILLTCLSTLITCFLFSLFFSFIANKEFQIMTVVFQGAFGIIIFSLEFSILNIAKKCKQLRTLLFSEKPFIYFLITGTICLTETLILSLFSIEFLQNREFDFFKFCYEYFFLRTFAISSASMLFLYIFSLLKFTRNLFMSILSTILTVNLLFFAFGYIQVFSEVFNFFTLTLVSTFLSTLIILYRNNSRETEFIIHNLNNSISRKDSEYLQLKNQVNPHFLFNNLNTLISFIEIEPKKAIEFGHHLSNVYRHYLKSEADDFVLLSDELRFINDYLEIYKAKFESGFSFEIKNDATENLYILSFSLQEIIDNIFKHTILDEEKPIKISVSLEENYLKITNSLNPQNKVISTNKGLQNINNRNKILINKEIIISKNESSFEIKIPILKLEN